MYDVVIVGGGPAGATLARLIGSKMKVLILDRRDLGSTFSGGFEKCCGGLLAPDAQEMLARFGLGVPKGVLVGPQLFTVRTIDIPANLERYYQRNYVNVDREAFDRWLISLIPKQVDLQWGAIFRGTERDGDGMKVHFSRAGNSQTVKTRLVVGADGAFSKVRLALGNRPNPNMYISIQEWFQVEQPQPYYSAIFDPAVTDFYSWTIPKEELLIVGTAILAVDNVTKRFEILKQKLSERGFDLRFSVKKRGTHLLRPSRIGQLLTGHGSIALIGEAAGWVSPSSAEGLSYAFKSALALARALERGTNGAVSRYGGLCRGLRLNILGKTLKSPAMYHPLLRQGAIRSGLLSMDIIE
jgi:flavin-dependent dehydrogenase